MLITSKATDIAFKRGYDARVAEERQCDDHVSGMREDADELRRLRDTSSERVKEYLSEAINDIEAAISEAT